jgi:hypothetical protein
MRNRSRNGRRDLGNPSAEKFYKMNIINIRRNKHNMAIDKEERIYNESEAEMSGMLTKAVKECRGIIRKEGSSSGGRCICDKIANKEWQKKFKNIVKFEGYSGVLLSDKDVTDIKIENK